MAEPAESASLSQRALKDTGKLFASHVAAGMLSIGFSAWLYRLVPDWGLALWPVSMSLGRMISAIASLGMGITFVRVVPDLIARGEGEEAKRLLRTGLLLNAVFCALLSALLWLMAEPVARLIVRNPEAVPYARSLVLASMLVALRDRLEWGLAAVQAFGKTAILRLAVDAARSPLAVLLYMWLGVQGLIIALTVVPLAASLACIYWLWEYLRGGGLRSPLRAVRFSWPYWLTSLSGFVGGQVHYIVVGAVGGAEALAPYFVAYRLAENLRALDGMAINAVAPKLAERAGRQPEVRSEVLRKCSRYLFLALLPLHVGVAALSRPALSLYGGAQYVEAHGILALLSIAFFLEALYLLQRAHIQAFSRPAHLLVLQLIGGTLSLSGLLLLVTLFGAVGAALNSLVLAALLSVVSAIILRRTVALRYDTHAIRWATLGSACVAGLVWGVPQLLNLGDLGALLAMAGAGAAVYVCILAGRFSDSDFDLATGLLPRAVGHSSVCQRLRVLLTAHGRARHT